MNMFKYLLVFILLFVNSLWLWAAKPDKGVTVVFYNVENLFDTINTPMTNDGVFTPTGKYKWNSDKYFKKIENISSVLSDFQGGADFIGLAEIENAAVVEALLSHKNLKSKGYDYVHFESHDSRGIDVALMYRKDRFRIEGSQQIRWGQKAYLREHLLVWGVVNGVRLHIFVAHTPSQLSSAESREAACVGLRVAIDSVAAKFPKANIVVMGDLNDNPTSSLLTKTLKLDTVVNNRTMKKSAAKYLYNPFAKLFNAGQGTTVYNRRWNMYDNIVVNGNLILSGAFVPADGGIGIYNPSRVLEKSGAKRGFPRRMIVSGKWQNGFSDHLAVGLWLDL